MNTGLGRFYEHFDIRKMNKNTWIIGTKYPATPWGCDCYLLECGEKCVLIDSGMSKLNIHDYIKEVKVTDKPVVAVINTHSHFDHTGGNGYFDSVYMNPIGEKAAKTPFDGNTEDYPLNYEITPVKDGDILDFGDRPLLIMEIGAHDLSSIAIFDLKNRILFTGDELETGWCNVNMRGENRPGQTIESHYNNMKKLYSHYDEFDVICPGHHGAPIDKSTLLEIMHCDEMILSGVPGETDTPNPPCDGYRVMRYKQAHIGYNEQAIFEKIDDGLGVG